LSSRQGPFSDQHEFDEDASEPPRSDGQVEKTSAVDGLATAHDGERGSRRGRQAPDGQEAQVPNGGDSDDNGADEDDDDDDASDPRRRLIEWVLIIAASLLVAFLGRTYVMQTYTIPSESMEHTIDKGDWVLVEKLSTRFGSPSRGDIVVFSTPELVRGPSVPDVLIKRVIGVPGDTVEGREGRLFLNGVQQDEPYTAEPESTVTFGPVTVGENEYFMMGDNRGNSRDSTVFGPIPEDSIIGKARLRVWPLSRWGGL